jgi:hypothetical protein
MGASDTPNKTEEQVTADALKQQMRVSSNWTNLMLASQLFFSCSLFYSTSFLFLVVHSMFVFFGIAGLARKSKCLLFTHFLYTTILSFFLTFGLCYALMAGYYIPLFIVPFAFAFLLIQSVGMRHERALMVLISLEQEMNANSVESGLNQPLQSVQQDQSIPEEQRPFLVYEQPRPMTEEEEMQHIIALIDAQNQTSSETVVPPVSVPAQTPAEYAPTMPQYPFVFPQQNQQAQQPPQPFVYVPYQINPATGEQGYYPAPMMYPGMPFPQPYPAMMFVPPTNPDNKQ